MGVQWGIWCYKYDREFSWGDYWLREASWGVAQEATAIEAKFANSRVKQWRKLIAEVIEKGDKQAHRWTKLPTMWMQADIHSAEGVQSHAARLQADDQQGWLDKNVEGYHYAVAERSSEQAVWTQSLLAEAGLALKRHTATVMLDLKKALEKIPHATLRAVGCRHGFKRS
eukprot:2005394-Pyramimonas_sp.AAC.1